MKKDKTGKQGGKDEGRQRNRHRGEGRQEGKEGVIERMRDKNTPKRGLLDPEANQTPTRLVTAKARNSTVE